MTQPPLPPPTASWLPPILFGAALTVMLWVLPDLLAGLLPALFPMTHCCCCGYALPIGIVPALIASRRDPSLTPGQGFAVSFIAAGIGSWLVAGLGVLAAREAGRDQFAENVRQVLEAWNERAPADQQLSGEELEQSIAFWATVAPYVPVLLATVLTVVAGVLGLVTIVVRSRRARQAPLPPPAA